MPDDVACPDPNEVVTRQILGEELGVELAKVEGKLFKRLSEEIARQLGAYEEQRRAERKQEQKFLVEEMQKVVKAMFDERPTQKQFDDHEARIVRLESRPAKRARRSMPRKTTK